MKGASPWEYKRGGHFWLLLLSDLEKWVEVLQVKVITGTQTSTRKDILGTRMQISTSNEKVYLIYI